MSFHKHIFPIRLNERAKNPLKIVTGWSNEDYTIGFHNSGKCWVATDLCSGTQICYFRTRKECAEWAESHKEKIENRRLDPIYIQYVMEFREIIKKELKENYYKGE